MRFWLGFGPLAFYGECVLRCTTSIFRTGSITSHGIMIQHQQGCYGCCAGPAIKCQRRACPQLSLVALSSLGQPSDGHTEVIKEFFQENAVAGRRVEAGRPSTDVTGAISHKCAQLSTVQTLDCPFKYWFVNSESQFMVMFHHPEYQPRRLITPEINIDQSSCINYVPML